jgi:hypothetical protein
MRQMSRVIVVFVVTAIGRREVRFRQAVALTALTGFVGTFAWMLFLLPVFLGFALSVGSAIGWCIWLEHHPKPCSLDLEEPSAILGRAEPAGLLRRGRRRHLTG